VSSSIPSTWSSPCHGANCSSATVAVFETDGLDPYGSVVGMAAIIRRSLNAPFTARAGKEYYVELTGPIVGAVKWYVATQ